MEKNYSSKMLKVNLGHQVIKHAVLSFLTCIEIVELSLTDKTLNNILLSNEFYNQRLYHWFYAISNQIDYSCLINDQLLYSARSTRQQAASRLGEQLRKLAPAFSKSFRVASKVFKEQNRGKQMLTALINILRQPQIIPPPLKRNNIGRFAQTPLQNFLSNSLHQSKQIGMQQNAIFMDLNQQIQKLKPNLDGVPDILLLKMRYQYATYENIQITGNFFFDILQAVVSFIIIYIKGACISLQQIIEELEAQQILSQIIYRHRALTHAVIQLESQLNFLGSHFDKLFVEKHPTYPHYPSFDIWRVLLKTWVTHYQQICHSNIKKALQACINKKYHMLTKNVQKIQYQQKIQWQQPQLIIGIFQALLDMSLDQISVHFLNHTKHQVGILYKEFADVLLDVQQIIIDKSFGGKLTPQLVNFLHKDMTCILRPNYSVQMNQRYKQAICKSLKYQLTKIRAFNIQLPADTRNKFKPPPSGYSNQNGQLIDLAKKVQLFIQQTGNQFDEEIQLYECISTQKKYFLDSIQQVLNQFDTFNTIKQESIDKQIIELGQRRGMNLQPQYLQFQFYSFRNKLTVDLVLEVMQKIQQTTDQPQAQEDGLEQYFSDSQEEIPTLSLKRSLK